MISYKPKKGQLFWTINSRFQVKMTENNGTQKSADRIRAGNAFPDSKSASEFAYLVQQGAMGHLIGFKRPSFADKLLSRLFYLFLFVLLVAAICLTVGFICWVYNIKLEWPL